MSESTLLGQSLTQREREKTFKEELFLEIKTEIIVTHGQVKGYAPVCRPSNMREVEQFCSRRVKLRSLSARNTWLLWLPQRGVLQKTRPTIFGHDIFINVFFNHVFLIEKKAAKCLLKSREQLARISPYFRENCAFIFSVVSRKAPLVCEVTQEAAIKNTVYCLFFSKLCIPSHGAIYFTYTAEVNKCLRKPSLFVHSLL